MAESPAVPAAPFATVESLIREGRWREAAAALKRTARGAAPWESYIWLGRIEENRGRLDRAERAFRGALAASPASPQPRIELSRLLERQGRGEEALELLRDAAAQAAGAMTVLSDAFLRGELERRPAENLYTLMEFKLYRKVFLEELCKASVAPERAESVLRGALAQLPTAGARCLLAEFLLGQGRVKDAQTELAAAFLAKAGEAESARVELLLKIIDQRRFGTALERALLAALARAGPAEKLMLEWPQLFSALVCAHRYPAAFRLAEAVLDRCGGFKSAGQMLWPWHRNIRRAVCEGRFLARELSFVRRAGEKGPWRHWFAYFRVVLLNFLGRNQDAEREYARLRALDPARYSWMLQAFVLVRLDLLDFDGAIAVCRRVLARDPGHWWVRCRMAEAFLAKGSREAGLREFEAAFEHCGEGRAAEVLTWHGEALLWLGEYERALSKLDEAVAAGALTFVFGWRGAARFKLGDHAGALEDLGRAIERDPKDLEARVWRGELLRTLGRAQRSREDLDIVIEAASDNFWARFNRALLRDSLGDTAGVRADVAAIRPEILSFLARALSIPEREACAPAEIRRILKAGLSMANGIRRWESYVQPIWMEGIR